MFCTRFIFVIASLFALAFAALAAPAVSVRAQEAQLEKRITHTGQALSLILPKGVTEKGDCGEQFTDSDLVVAISPELYKKSNCDQYMHITDSENGKSVWAKTVDKCQTSACEGDSISLSEAAFEKLAPLSQGSIHVSWHFEVQGFVPPS